jgi:hypothetical protein
VMHFAACQQLIYLGVATQIIINKFNALLCPGIYQVV